MDIVIEGQKKQAKPTKGIFALGLNQIEITHIIGIYRYKLEGELEVGYDYRCCTNSAGLGFETVHFIWKKRNTGNYYLGIYPISHWLKHKSLRKLVESFELIWMRR